MSAPTIGSNRPRPWRWRRPGLADRGRLGIVAASDPHEGNRAGDGGHCLLELGTRAKCVALPRDEQARDLEPGKVLRPELLALAGWVERVAQQHEACGGQPIGDRHRAHASPEGAPAQHQLVGLDPRAFDQSGGSLNDRRDRDGRSIRGLAARFAIGKIYPAAGPRGNGVCHSQQGVMIAVGPSPGKEQKRPRILRMVQAVGSPCLEIASATIRKRPQAVAVWGLFRG